MDSLALSPRLEGLQASNVDIDKVIEIAVDDEEIVQRMSGSAGASRVRSQLSR